MTHRRPSRSSLSRRSLAGAVLVCGSILLFTLVVVPAGPHGGPYPRVAGARALDALCGDGYCDPLLESEAACYDDCGRCGDGVCTRGAEDVVTCYDDCGFEAAVSSRR